MLLHGIDLTEIENHLKEVVNLVYTENQNVKLNIDEDNVYILLDIHKNDITAYRVTSGIIVVNEKPFIEIKRTLGKWSINDLKNLIGVNESDKVINTIKKILPIVNGFISLIKLKEFERKISIQIHITKDEIIAYQIALAIIENNEKNVLVVNRILDKYKLSDYLK